MARHLGHAFHAVERPAPALVRVQAKVVEPPVDGVWGSVQVAGEFSARDQSDTFTEVPVLQLAPRLLPAPDADAGRRPGLPKCLEMSQHGVQRRIRTPSRPSATTLAMPSGDCVPFFG